MAERPFVVCVLWLAVFGAVLVACSSAAWAEEPWYDYQIIARYPHDPHAFTQGLLFHEGILYESTGLYGRSSLRQVEVETGRVLQQVDLAAEYFGEGLALWEDQLLQLTWQEEVGFIYDYKSFELEGTFAYSGEGWGLTHDGKTLILSNGSHQLLLLDPRSFEELGRVDVVDQNGPVSMLNELEYIGGEVWANIWLTNLIVRIDPQSGKVLGWIDLSGLAFDAQQGGHSVDVLNGIAYDNEQGRIFVTGKLWPNVYEIELVPRMRRTP